MYKPKTTPVLVFCLLVTQSAAEPDLYNLTEGQNLIQQAALVKCHTKRRFEVLPGLGWDNLQNKEMGQIFVQTYENCRTTDDGKYLIPDGLTVIPLKESHIAEDAEVFADMQSYTSVTSKSSHQHVSVKVSLIFASASASYSRDYQDTKMLKMQHHGKTSTLRMQARYTQYRAISSGSRLHSSFKNRLLEIAKFHELRDEKMARYLSQALIRDYGTHVITASDAGGIIVKEDEMKLTENFREESEKTELRVSASISFSVLFGLIKAGAHYENSQSDYTDKIKSYNEKTMHTTIRSFGGPIFKVGLFNISDWLKQLGNNLVTIDRQVEPIYSIVTEEVLPEITEANLREVQESLLNAFNVYYQRNIYRGCMDMNSPNFDAKANVDDGTCKPQTETASFSFGGAFQTCSMELSDDGDLCASNSFNNILTGQKDCPQGFSQVLLYTSSLLHATPKTTCHGFWIFKHCKTELQISRGSYKVYWCASITDKYPTQRYTFGGIYSSARKNSLTNRKACPKNYIPQPVGEDLVTCVSAGESIADDGLPFGGMFSCQYGNPLANNSNSKSCPSGFSVHLATIDDECEIDYCAKPVNNGVINQSLPVLQRPPFMKRPLALSEESSDVIIHSDGSWLKDEHAYTKLSNVSDLNRLSSTLLDYVSASQSFTAAAILTSSLGGNYTKSVESDATGHSLEISQTTVAGIASATTVASVLITMLIIYKSKVFSFSV